MGSERGHTRTGDLPHLPDGPLMSKSLGDRARDSARNLLRVSPLSVQRRVLGAMDKHSAWDSGLPPVAPPVPASMTTGSPDFVGVGVPKCGTTWWFSLIMSHPDIHVENEKELQFFNIHFLRLLDAGKITKADVETYRQWFPRPAGSITGEWTPHYAFAHQLPPVLQVAAPGAKLLFMLRDPVERYRSDVSRKTSSKRLDLLRYRAMFNGLYSDVLKPWEQAYAPQEMLVLQFEACLAAPDEMLAQTFRFLGVDDSYRPPQIRTPVNKTQSKRGLDRDIEVMLDRLYVPSVLDLAARYPQIDLRLWPNFAHLVDRPGFPAPPV